MDLLAIAFAVFLLALSCVFVGGGLFEACKIIHDRAVYFPRWFKP